MAGTLETHATSRAPDGRLGEIRAYLAQLLDTPQFAASSRRGQLLQYLVRETLAGNGDKITEYAIGLEVFRKPDSFDPRIESVVRTEFSRLRQRLKAWYADEGRRDRIVIDFRPRSYAAIFEFRDPDALVEPAGAPQLVPEAGALRRSSPARWILASGAVAAIALAAAGAWMWRQHTQAASHQPIGSIVVLPFENYSPNRADEYLADGMTDEITNDLAQWRDLRVVARTSAYAFKGKGEDIRQIGRQLNVDAVLEGSFTKQGDRIRVTAQLNRTSDGYHLWSHAYETQSRDLLQLQEEAANSIAAAIRMVRGGGSPPVIHMATVNAEAEDLYLQGMYQAYQDTPDSTRKALSLFEGALAKDPSFARAYLGIGNAELNLVSLTSSTAEEALPKVREAAQKAIALDPSLGSAWGELGLMTYSWDWNWTRAEEQFRQALEHGAGAGTRENYGWGLATRGRFAEAHEQFHTAAEEDPLSVAPPFDEFFTYNFERDLAGQKRMLAQMQRLQPNFLGSHALAVVTSVQQHDCATAAREAAWAARRYPGLGATQSVLAYAAACRNNRAEALARIGRMEALKAPAYQLAIAWALLQDKDKAIAALTRSADAHEGQILYLKYDPFFDSIRSDPRYVALEKRVGLL